jgi:hypothetical protein
MRKGDSELRNVLAAMAVLIAALVVVTTLFAS